MRIAIHAADLDHDRIDGTRVYMKNVLQHIGKLSPSDEFLIYHGAVFNPALAPQKEPNYFFKSVPFRWFWTQTRFAWEVFCDKPDALWLPMHNLPFLRRKNLRTAVTIHDLAFKIFPAYFPARDLRKLNLLTDYAIRRADKLIAVSHSTKNDILKFYPEIPAEKITVVHHGFDAQLFQKNMPEAQKVLASYGLESKKYLLYVGAIQPRKNLETLLDAFEKLKEGGSDLKLVLAGEKAWLWEGVTAKIARSPFGHDIVLTGAVPFAQLPALYQNAGVFVFPSLYEGFGIPLLEAFASGTPVVAAGNSSLPEVGGEAALYFQAEDSAELAEKIGQVLGDESLRAGLIEKGSKRLAEFSWEKCAQETLAVIAGK